MERFNASIDFDKALAQVDILGSIAHANTLVKAKVLTQAEADTITDGLKQLSNEIAKHQVEFSRADEDIHMNIERLLQQKIGDLASKLHTGRSRNDQVALDLHLYLRQHAVDVIATIFRLQKALYQQAEQHINTILPGYTHLQRAQPVRFAHHLLAYVAMLHRDIERFQGNFKRINVMPLGAGALAGSGFAMDRKAIATELAFDEIYQNSMDAVSDRDFIIEFMANSSILMMHLSRLSEEIILWSSSEFNYIELDDAYTTGSSMMPQKKNPDAAELVRGKSGRVYGALVAMLTVFKGLPLAYNKDMQEDKEGLFDTLTTIKNCLEIYAPMIETMKVNHKQMLKAANQSFANATELADYLVKKQIPFRQSHEIVGGIVLYCVNKNIVLSEMPLETMKSFCDKIDEDVYQVLQVENAVEARAVEGGTAKVAVEKQMKYFGEEFMKTEKWLSSKVVPPPLFLRCHDIASA